MDAKIIAGFQDELEKISVGIRKAIKMVPKVIDYTASAKPVVRWTAQVGKKEIGEIVTKGNQVSWSHLEPEFRGMGLGRKMYGEVMRRMPEQTLVSDTSLSRAARGTWGSLKKNPKYKVETPFGGGRGPEILGQKATIRPQFKASLPSQSAVDPKLKDLPEHVKREAVKRQRLNKLEGYLTLAALPVAAYGNVKMRQATAKRFGKGKKKEKEKAAADKEAALKEIVRLMAKDIPGTPRLFMRHRSTAERAALGETAEQLANKISDPAMAAAEKGLSKLPPGKVQDAARRGAEMIIRDPLGHGLAALTPVPVLPHAGVEALKKGIKKGIDYIDPIT